MGMAAGQARLFSITQRLNDNELKAQSITRAKTRLSDSMSAIGDEYIEALNRTQLKYSTYDADGNVSYQKLTGALFASIQNYVNLPEPWRLFIVIAAL